MLRQNDQRFRRNVLAAAHDVADAEDVLCKPGGEGRPCGDDTMTRLARQRRHRKHDEAVGNDDEQQYQLVKRRAQEVHGDPSNASATAARSGKMRVPGGRFSCWVLTPLPVSTSMGCALTAAAAWRSRSASPTAGTSSGGMFRRSPIPTSMPGLGLR